MSPMNITMIFLALTTISATLDNCPLLEPASSKDNLAGNLNLGFTWETVQEVYQTAELAAELTGLAGVLKLTHLTGSGGNIDQTMVGLAWAPNPTSFNVTGSIPQPLETNKPAKGKLKQELKPGDTLQMGLPSVNYRVISSGGFVDGDLDATIASIITNPTTAEVSGGVPTVKITPGTVLQALNGASVGATYSVEQVTGALVFFTKNVTPVLRNITNQPNATGIVTGPSDMVTPVYQRQGWNGKSMLFIQGAVPDTPALFYYGILTISMKSDCPVCAPFVPVICGVLGSGTAMVQTTTSGILEFRVSLAEGGQPVLFCVTELGYATSGAYKYVDPNLDVEITSDLFSKNPLTGTIVDYDGDKNFTASPTLVPNKRQILARLRRRLRDSAVFMSVPGRQLEQMAFSAFNNEIASYFRCEPYPARSICCNSIFPAYVELITSTLSVITGCAESSSELILRPWGRETDNPSWALNREICKVASQSHFNSEISALFSELVYPEWRPL